MKHIEEAAGEGFTSLVNNFGREQIIAILTEYWLLEALYERLSVTNDMPQKPPYSNLVTNLSLSQSLLRCFIMNNLKQNIVTNSPVPIQDEDNGFDYTVDVWSIEIRMNEEPYILNFNERFGELWSWQRCKSICFFNLSAV